MSAALAWAGVGVFGALGAWLRFAVGGAITARRPGDFPLGTFVVNLTGGLLLGVLTGAGVTGHALLVLGTGLLGGYTTFSTWMVETQRLGEDAEWAVMYGYLLGSMAGGLATTGLGWLLGGALS
jgi:CrcB protein